MINNKKVVVVMPAYNAEKTLEKTVNDIPMEFVDKVILVDDASKDKTTALGEKLGLKTLTHKKNLGYGGNQKTCYTEALASGADIVVMVHPDYQYDPRLVPALASPIAYGVYDAVFASRILGKGALAGGMPLYKFFANRLLTSFQNILLGQRLSEYHTGYRAFSKKILESLPLEANSNDFIFDNQMIAQIFYFNMSIGEVSCPTRYMKEASSINFLRSCKYGLGVLWTSIQYRLSKMGLIKPKMFDSQAPRLATNVTEARIIKS